MPGAVRMGQVVDRDPVGSLARTAAQELPGPLRLGRERPFEEREGEPARLEVLLAEQAIGDEQQRGRAVAARRLPETADDGREQRPADAVRRAEARRDDLLALEVLRIGQGRRGPSRRAAAKRVGILEVVGQAVTRGPRRPACGRRRTRRRGPSWGLWAAAASLTAVTGLPSTESGGSAVIPASGRQP